MCIHKAQTLWAAMNFQQRCLERKYPRHYAQLHIPIDPSRAFPSFIIWRDGNPGCKRIRCLSSIITMSRRPKKDLRACLLCSIVLPLKEFVDHGCPNCQDLMSSPHDGTTSNWEGTVALINPGSSWVSKWQGLTNYVPSLYAVR
jgi:RNA polymerase subunit RPABC4/transcription elongation factor Spt4